MNNVRKFIKDNTPLSEIFKRSGFARVLQALANSSLTYYGFSTIPVRVGWDSNNQDVAYISDEECYINFDSPLDKGLGFIERKKTAIGKLTHEVFGHGLHTDFSKMKSLQKSKDEFPYRDYFQNAQNYTEIHDAYQDCPEIFNSVFFNVENIVEDPVIEYLAIQKYPGFKKYVDYLQTLLVKDIQNGFKKDQETVNVLNLLLAKARNCFDDKYLEQFPEFAAINCFSDLSLLPTYEDRLFASANCIDILWVYFKEMFEQAKQNQQLKDEISNFLKDNNMSANENRSKNGQANNANDSSNKKQDINKNDLKTDDADSTDATKETSSNAENGQHTDEQSGKLDGDSNNFDEQADKLSEIYNDLSKEASKGINDVVDKICAHSDKKELEQIIDNTSTKKIIAEHYGESLFNVNTHFSADKDEYNSLFTNEIKRTANTLSKKVLKALKERHRGNVLFAQDEGSMLDVNSYAEGSDRIFMDITAPTKKPLCAVEIMIDKSGSMKGNKAVAACKMALLLEYFCRNLKIPLDVFAHSENCGTCKIDQLLSFSDVKNNNAASKITNVLCAGGCNHDGKALHYGIQKLKRRSENTKIFFVISDGLPNGCNYGTKEMINEMPYLKKECKKHNIILVPIAIDSCYDALLGIYGKNLVDGRDLNRFPKEVANILLKNIKKLI